MDVSWFEIYIYSTLLTSKSIQGALQKMNRHHNKGNWKFEIIKFNIIVK